MGCLLSNQNGWFDVYSLTVFQRRNTTSGCSASGPTTLTLSKAGRRLNIHRPDRAMTEPHKAGIMFSGGKLCRNVWLYCTWQVLLTGKTQKAAKVWRRVAENPLNTLNFYPICCKSPSQRRLEHLNRKLSGGGLDIVWETLFIFFFQETQINYLRRALFTFIVGILLRAHYHDFPPLLK